jgi:hypothetical protein
MQQTKTTGMPPFPGFRKMSEYWRIESELSRKTPGPHVRLSNLDAYIEHTECKNDRKKAK